MTPPRINTAAVASLIAVRASPGVAMVADTPDGRAEFACGTYSDADLRPVDAHTAYDAASITKLFTTALILRLHDGGSLGIGDAMGKYLPHFRASALTVTDMLTHHARLECAPLSRMALDTPGVVELAARIPISPSASGHFFYQNATFLFLGMLVSELCRKSLSRCMEELIAELGMRETFVGSDPRLDAPPTEIRGGAVWANKTHDESSYLCGGITGYAGIFASACDLVKFGRAWLDFRIATPETTKKAFSCYSNFPGEEQGLGWYNNLPRFPLFPDRLFCHSGYTGPLLAVNPDEGRVYAATLNRTYYGRENQLYRELWAWLLERELREAMTMPAFIRRMELNLARYRKAKPD
ncbi:MAG: beta-lactamase family protein [Synergistaceae bacterium]|jgi:CubicO group peptidase (beta-lactamase class C family)|nr:beta-lactamase family protein [Synergistaceae bacterium]